MTASLRVAVLTYSVKPRGGVVHSLELARALAARGHRVEIAALARAGEGFFRRPDVPAHLVRFQPDESMDFDARVAAMIAAYRDGLRPWLAGGRFDVVHAQDCLSANAALGLRDAGVIPHVLRTVHHVDEFRSPSLIACQDRSILAPDMVVCVSRAWVEPLRAQFGVEAGVVTNGVDLGRFRPPALAAERAADREALDLGDRLTVLAIGGIEPRKGSLTLLEGFAGLRLSLAARRPLLLIGGGATLFDYRSEVDRFWERAAELGVAAHVRSLGPLSDELVARAYRAADVLAFPSAREGFGLVPLEALAAGLPVVASDIDVLREFLVDGGNALLVPPGDGAALAAALGRVATEPGLAARLRVEGLHTAARYSWDACAAAHESGYAALAGRMAPIAAAP